MKLTTPDLAPVSAIILAAGMSTRMGQPKMLLPWGKNTVIETVVGAFLSAPLAEILVVVGANHQLIESCLCLYPVKFVFNPDYSNGEMLISLQAGLRAVQPASQQILVALGDQPGIQVDIVQKIVQQPAGSDEIIFPSYQNRRGHPWKISKEMVSELLELAPPQTLRDFMHRHQNGIRYVEVDSPSILNDLDTPEDYQKQRPEVS